MRRMSDGQGIPWVVVDSELRAVFENLSDDTAVEIVAWIVLDVYQTFEPINGPIRKKVYIRSTRDGIGGYIEDRDTKATALVKLDRFNVAEVTVVPASRVYGNRYRAGG